MTPVKHGKNIILIPIILVAIIWYATSRIKLPIALDTGWSAPIAVASTQNGFAGGGSLYKWHDTLVQVDGQCEWVPHSSIVSSSTCLTWVHDPKSTNFWTQQPAFTLPGCYALYLPAFDEASDKVMLAGGYIENNVLHMSALFAHLSANRGIQIETKKEWAKDQESLLGKTGTNVTLNDPPERTKRSSRNYPSFGGGIIAGSEVYVAFSISAYTFFDTGPTPGIGDGPYYHGVFHSMDLGETWQMEQVSDTDSFDFSIRRTKANLYFFANGVVGKSRGLALWFSRKPAEGSSWEPPKAVAWAVPYGVDERYSAVADGDTIHICWLDNRHETKYWLSLARSGRGNYEVAYCGRKDSDSRWRKDVILSRGIMFAYSPSISAEGDKVVVAWAGAQTAHAWPFEGDPSDIYYATSKDDGKTWSRPLQVTDLATNGITSASVRVAIQNGVIHLFYAQGRYDRDAQVSQQGGWPVYYQQRTFPN